MIVRVTDGSVGHFKLPIVNLKSGRSFSGPADPFKFQPEFIGWENCRTDRKGKASEDDWYNRLINNQPSKLSFTKAEVLGSFIATTIREQRPGPMSLHKGATGRVRSGDQRYPVLCHC